MRSSSETPPGCKGSCRRIGWKGENYCVPVVVYHEGSWLVSGSTELSRGTPHSYHQEFGLLLFCQHPRVTKPQLGQYLSQSDWCWFKLILGSSSLLLRGSKDLSLAVGHESECPHSGTRYCQILSDCLDIIRFCHIYCLAQHKPIPSLPVLSNIITNSNAPIH